MGTPARRRSRGRGRRRCWCPGRGPLRGVRVPGWRRAGGHARLAGAGAESPEYQPGGQGDLLQIDVELGAPVLYVERIVHDTAGRPVEYVRSWYRGDRYEYAVTLDLGPDSDANPYVQLA
jgi:UTRA domain-containing protein